MIDTWVNSTFGQQITLQRGYDLPEYNIKPGNIPVVTSTGIFKYHSQAKANPPGVIMGRSGTLGKIHYVEVDYWPHNTALFVKDFHENYPKFIYYYLKNIDFTVFNAGTGVPTLNRNHLSNMAVQFPTLPIQQRIAEILGALDDKIECNRRINETLEKMAMALYKHWFVDFGPFRDGEFEETELGMVPNGWNVGNLGNIAKNISIGANPENLPKDTYYIGLEHMPKGSITLSEWGTVADVTSNKLKFSHKQILFGKLRPYFKKVGIAPFDGVCSSDILVINPKSDIYYGLLLTQLIQDDFIDYTTAGSSGTRMPRTSWEQMAKFPIVIPPDNIIIKLTNIINEWVDIIIHNISENNILSQTRDYLLPKLLSGEIEVKAAEKQVSEVI